MKKISILMLLLFMIPFILHGETISTVFVDGKAPIIIDGDLSDWNQLDITPIRLAQFNQKYSKPEKWDGESDLSASFVCSADNEYVYVGVGVTDEQLVFGEAPIDRPYWDDCVELFLYGDEIDSPIHIWVTASKEGKTKLEGQELGSKRFIPYYWEKQGVKAKLKGIGVGYVAEIAVPLGAVSQTGWVKGNSLGLNVGVYDDDEGNNGDNILEWSTIWGETINKVAFDLKNSSPESVTEQNENDKELEVVVSEPSKTEESEDPEVLLRVAKAYERSGQYSEAIKELEKIINNRVEKDIENNAKLDLARNYFYIKNYNNANELCNDLLNVDIDLRTKFKVNMILYSIDWNTKKEMRMF